MFGGIREHFGLDIGTSSIRVLELGVYQNKYVLKSFGSVPMAPGVTQSNSELDLERVSQTIETILRKSNIGTKNVVCAIPGSSVFNTTVDLPLMSNEELSKAIKYQAEQNLPLKLNEINFDYQVIREDPLNKKIKVIIIATPKTKIDQISKVIEASRLNLLAIETPAVALTRSLFAPDAPISLIMDVGNSASEIVITENGKIIQSRSLSMAGQAITQSISRQLGLETSQAEEFKKSFGLMRDKLDGSVYKATEPIIREILEEVGRSMKFYEEQNGKKIQRIILTGGTSRMPLFFDFVRSYTGIDVTMGNPWINVNYDARLSDSIIKVAPEFAIATGLAMRR